MIQSKTLFSGLTLLALSSVAPAQEWVKHFRIGMSMGLNMKTDFKTAGTFPVSGASPGPDPAAGVADRTYDDGYVRKDDTDSALNPNPGGQRVTTFWGIQRANQINAAGTEVAYTASTAFATSNERSVTDAVNLGFDMAYGASIAKWERTAIGAEFGFNLTPILARDRETLAANLNTVNDVYSTPNPADFANFSAPYSGPFTSAGAQTLNAIPIRRTTTTSPGTITGTRSLEGILYQFRLGPLVRWQMAPRWTLNGSAGGAFGLFDAEYVFNEQVGLGNGSSVSNKGKFGSLETSYGGYAGAVVMFDTGKYWEAYLGAHYMMMQDIGISSGGRSANLNLGSTVYISVGINWTF